MIIQIFPWFYSKFNYLFILRDHKSVINLKRWCRNFIAITLNQLSNFRISFKLYFVVADFSDSFYFIKITLLYLTTCNIHFELSQSECHPLKFEVYIVNYDGQLKFASLLFMFIKRAFNFHLSYVCCSSTVFNM